MHTSAVGGVRAADAAQQIVDREGVQMRLMNRTLLGILLTVGGVAGASAVAGALTVSPTGVYVDSSSNFRIVMTSNGQVLRCSSFAFELLGAADGSGAIVPSTVVASGCSNALLGTFTLTAETTWSAQVTLAPGAVHLTIAIPASGMKITASGCTIWMEGTIRKTATAASLPVTFRAMAISTSSLRVSRSSGALCVPFPGNLAATASGDIGLDRSMTVSG